MFVGTDPQSAVPYPITEAAWMPRGWKIKLAGIETEEAATALARQHLYAERAALPATAANEYYLAELVGAAVIEEATGIAVGTVSGVETTAGGDRWWVATPDGGELALPATKRFIAEVDVAERRLSVRHLDELRP